MIDRMRRPGTVEAGPLPDSETPAPVPVAAFSPERLESIGATGLRPEFINDLVLKCIYLYNTITPREMMALLKLPFTGVLEPTLKRLTEQDLILCGAVSVRWCTSTPWARKDRRARGS